MKKISVLFLSTVLFVSCNKPGQDISLLEDLSRWKGMEEIELTEGILLLEDEFTTLVYHPGFMQTFVNFEFSSEIMTSEGGNAALLFHTRSSDTDLGYEVRIDNSEPGNWDHLLKTGSLSSVRNVYYTTVENNEWFTLKVRVDENHITIHINDLPVVDYIEPAMPFRLPEMKKRRLNSGTFAIQTLFGNAGVEFRNIHVTRLPKSDAVEAEDPEFARRITELHSRNFPVVDFHVHEKGDLTLPFLSERSAKLGINYGIAANCGLMFPIQNDEQLTRYLESIKGLPIFKAMQAEGREWVHMFSPELVNKFDYAFTDAMTWTNSRGQRMRLWIPEETNVGDPQDFMEQLVAQIETVVTEPVAIYVNPTYLPAEIEDQYDELWTDERIDRVVKALKDNQVALELNSRLELPGKRMIGKAKEAGVKFAMGTNNTGSGDLGRLSWSLDIIEEFNLQPTDMFLPGSN